MSDHLSGIFDVINLPLADELILLFVFMEFILFEKIRMTQKNNGLLSLDPQLSSRVSWLEKTLLLPDQGG